MVSGGDKIVMNHLWTRRYNHLKNDSITHAAKHHHLWRNFRPQGRNVHEHSINILLPISFHILYWLLAADSTQRPWTLKVVE